ncbi:MAG TPA: hypothetical protein VEX41_06370 [Candidatus Eisenbacteria bacterium]|nr:hypothetical protein [Candidatus Eisenbacteria bacterium]
MARAKQTVRAEARRRYRQANRLEAEAPANVLGDDDGATDAPPRAKAAPADRPSIGSSFRNAYRPANVREDIALLPQLLLTRAFLAASALVVIAAVFVAVLPTNTLAGFAFQTFVLPPAIAPIFVAGFFAPRASYLIGLFVSLIDVVAYAFLVIVVAPTIGTTITTGPDVVTLVGTALLVGPTSGILFASAAAWYRRFLALSSRRRQPGGARGRSKAKAPGRR